MKIKLLALMICALCSVISSVVAGAVDGPVIEAIKVEELPAPFESHGDLWFSTWAADDSLFVTWGDGFGPEYSKGAFSHNGLARLTGNFPDVKPEIIQRYMPLSDDENNSKPTSILYLDGRLYVAIHSPLLDPNFGFIAYSDDMGKTFNYDIKTTRNRKENANFICAMVIGMGKNYELNTDGYVYALGMKAEINVSGNTYLARMPKDAILDESKWEYLEGVSKASGEASWSADYKKAKRIKALSEAKYTTMWPSLLVSAAYHPGIDRYLVMTATTTDGELFEAPEPWGPWTKVGSWFTGEDSPWYSAYMPGIISKDMGDDFFYFAVGGRKDFDPQPGDKLYSFRLGKLTMKIKAD